MFRNLLAKIARELDGSSIPYMVIGGQAVLLYGEPRLTRDIDISLGIDIDNQDNLIGVIQRLGLKILVKDKNEFIEKTRVLPVLDEEYGIRIDFIFTFSPYERQAIQRAQKITINDVPVRFSTLEDLIIHKMIAGRARDIEDIKSILMKNPDYDKKYILEWLEDFEQALGENYQEIFKRLLVE